MRGYTTPLRQTARGVAIRDVGDGFPPIAELAIGTTTRAWGKLRVVAGDASGYAAGVAPIGP